MREEQQRPRQALSVFTFTATDCSKSGTDARSQSRRMSAVQLSRARVVRAKQQIGEQRRG